MTTPQQAAQFNQAVVLLGNALEAAGGMYQVVLKMANELILEGPPPPLTAYSQRNPTWSADKMGATDSTIGLFGCVVSSAASILTDCGHPVTPGELNTWLSANGGYTNGNMFVFDSIDKLGIVRYKQQIFCPDKPAPMDVLEPWINQGNHAIVMIDFSPAPGVQTHWMRYIGGGLVIDPWQGDISTIVPRYKGKDAAEAILRIVMYERINPKG